MIRVANLDLNHTDDLGSRINTALKENEIVVIRDIKSITGGSLAPSEYANLMHQVGRVWTTQDELKAESKFQLPGHSEIIELRHDGLLDTKALPKHTDASHHPTRPFPVRALLAREIPQDGTGKTTWYSTYDIADVLGPFKRLYGDIVCWHQPAYGTGWAGRWNKLIDVDPMSGRQYVAFDDVFVKQWKRITPDSYGIDVLVDIPQNEIDSIKFHIYKAIVGESIYTHEWAPGDLVLWNNRGTMHSREPSTMGKRRVMWRITLDLVW